MKDYKKILEGVVDIINTTEKSDIGFANICTYIGENCPELAESEDERIRKLLVEAVTQVLQDQYCSNRGVSKEKVLAWLEKQGKNNMGISEATKQKLEDNLNKALEKETPKSCNEFLEKQGKKVSDPRYRILDKLIEADNIYQMSVNDAMVEEAKNKAIEALSKLEISKLLGLEKQGEQKTTIEMKTPEESLGIDSETYNKIVDECVYGEQKPIKEHNACEFCEDRYGCVSPCSMKLIEKEKPNDKVKPKFHEGDWVIGRATNNEPRQIAEIKEEGYKTTYGEWIGFSFEEDMRLWAIEDAKDGDVLVSESTCGLGTWYCIFKSLDGDESMTVYCYLTRDGRFETKKELCFDKDPYNTKPATKEQRDTLLKAMADAGYIFDFDKKELKKIEQKPAWGEEDIELLDNTIKFIEDRVAATSPSLRTYSPTLTGKEIPFLKALKDRYTWKPSKREKEALLWCVVHLGGADKQTLGELLEALNKL